MIASAGFAAGAIVATVLAFGATTLSERRADVSGTEPAAEVAVAPPVAVERSAPPTPSGAGIGDVAERPAHGTAEWLAALSERMADVSGTEPASEVAVAPPVAIERSEPPTPSSAGTGDIVTRPAHRTDERLAGPSDDAEAASTGRTASDLAALDGSAPPAAAQQPAPVTIEIPLPTGSSTPRSEVAATTLRPVVPQERDETPAAGQRVITRAAAARDAERERLEDTVARLLRAQLEELEQE